eukprot:Gb_37839 [translate_table: standard]
MVVDAIAQRNEYCKRLCWKLEAERFVVEVDRVIEILLFVNVKKSASGECVFVLIQVGALAFDPVALYPSTPCCLTISISPFDGHSMARLLPASSSALVVLNYWCCLLRVFFTILCSGLTEQLEEGDDDDDVTKPVGGETFEEAAKKELSS